MGRWSGGFVERGVRDLANTVSACPRLSLEERLRRHVSHAVDHHTCQREREFFIGNLLVRIHFIVVMIRWTGLAPRNALAGRCHTPLIPTPATSQVIWGLMPSSIVWKIWTSVGDIKGTAGWQTTLKLTC